MNRPSTLADYLALLRRRKWIILQAVVLIPVLAVVLSRQQDPVYSASAEVLLTRQSLAAALAGISDPLAFQDPARLAQTQADLARVPAVADRAVESIGSPRSGWELLSNSAVYPKSNADLLVFEVRDGDPDAAVALANAYARQFTLYRREQDTQALRGARLELRTRIQQLEASGLSRDSDLYSKLLDSEQQLRTLEALQTSNTHVSRPASGAGQIEPRVERNGVLGLLLGIVLGLGLAFLWDALDRRVRSEKEIADALGLPLLARLPAPPRRLRRSEELVMFAEPQGFRAEAFRTLRTSIEFANLESPTKAILVTSAGEGEGKSTTIANLGVAFALTGRRTVLVDLDLRRPALERLLRLRRGPGVTDVVLGHVTLESALQSVALPAANEAAPTAGNGGGSVASFLEVLACGTTPPNPGDFVRTAALGGVLARLRERYEVVLVDAPPMLAVGDALALSSHVDGLLVAVDLSSVKRPSLAELARVLGSSFARPLGFVLTGTGRGHLYGYAYEGYVPQRATADTPEALRD